MLSGPSSFPSSAATPFSSPSFLCDIIMGKRVSEGRRTRKISTAGSVWSWSSANRGGGGVGGRGSFVNNVFLSLLFLYLVVSSRRRHCHISLSLSLFFSLSLSLYPFILFPFSHLEVWETRSEFFNFGNQWGSRDLVFCNFNPVRRDPISADESCRQCLPTLFSTSFILLREDHI